MSLIVRISREGCSPQIGLLQKRICANIRRGGVWPVTLRIAERRTVANSAKKTSRPLSNPYKSRNSGVLRNPSPYKGPATLDTLAAKDKPTLIYQAPSQRLLIVSSITASLLLFGSGSYMLIWMNRDEGKYFPAWMRLGYTSVGILLLVMCGFVAPSAFNMVKSIKLLPWTGRPQDVRRLQLEIKKYPLPFTKIKKIEGNHKDFKSSIAIAPIAEENSTRSTRVWHRFFNYTKMMFTKDGLAFVEFKGKGVGRVEIAGYMLDNGKGTSHLVRS